MRTLSIVSTLSITLLLFAASFAAAAEHEPDSAFRTQMLADIAEVQSLIDQQGLEWQAGETSRTRMTREERRRSLMQDWTPPPEPRQPYVLRGYDRSGTSLDWRDNDGNFVTGIRNQRDCGSCWDFGATAVLESAFLISIGGGGVPDFDLSEQHVLSCMDDYGLGGSCAGGWPEYVYGFASNVGMIEEFCLPYSGNDQYPCGEVCADVDERSYVFSSAWGPVTGSYDNIEAIKDALHTYGPLSTCMEVYEDFDMYDSGTYQHTWGAYEGGHVVQIIGYNDVHQNWIAKNSWGENWGEGGFFYISWNSNCEFGEYTCYATHDTTGMGPFAALEIADRRPKTAEPVRFWDRSVPVSGEIVSWEWDFDGDGEIDATGPGPHDYTYMHAGLASPWLRVTDADGQQDVCSYTDWVLAIFDGPVWTVDAVNGSAEGDGSPEHPFIYIQYGLNIAVDADTIIVKPGVYAGFHNRQLRAYGKEILLMGDGAPGEIVLDGQNTYRHMVMDQGEGPGFVVRNLLFRNGRAATQGGSVLIEASSPRFVDCRFENCTLADDPSGQGGAIWTNGEPIFEGCEFVGNVSHKDGGAIYSAGDYLYLGDCRFTGNSASDAGGAVHAAGGAVEALRCVFADNTTLFQGAGLSLAGANARIDACLFDGNTVPSGGPGMCAGGGLAATGGEIDIANCIFYGNTAPIGGGAYLSVDAAILAHVTAWGNTAGLFGGALATLQAAVGCCNSVFWNDTAPASAEIFASNAGPEAFHCCVVQGGYPGVDILDEDPCFIDPAAADFHLDTMSPCIASGHETCGSPLDFDGLPRPQPEGTAPDLGACESPLPGTAVGDGGVPGTFALRGSYPNPFNPSTRIVFDLPAAASVQLDVFDIAGRRVATLVDDRLPAATHTVAWYGRDDAGCALPSGLYLVRLRRGAESVEHKLVLLK
jgi:C1A family cysteine protease